MRLNHHPQNTQEKKTNKKNRKKGFEFCKIIHSNIIQDQCLILPLKFAQNFGNDISNTAILKVPDGKRWHVELRKTDGQIMFHNGWQEVVEYYSISTGHFLVFRYNGRTTFRVIIFDATCSEINYPNNVDNLEEQNCGQEIEDERLNSDCDANGIISSKKREEFAVMPTVKRHSSPKTPVTQKPAVLGKEKDADLLFKVIIIASYLRYLLIPASFSNRHHLKGSLKNLTLEVSEGHRWLIGCILYRGTNLHLSRGWQKFVQENNLKAGDVCVFEMIEHALWKVHISRKWTSSPTLLKEEDGRHSTAKQGKGVVVPILEGHLRAKAFVTSKEKTRTTETSRVLKLNCGEEIEDERLNSDCDANGIISSKKREEFAIMPSFKRHSSPKTPVTQKSAVLGKEKDADMSFKVVITASYLSYLPIPASFSNRHHLKGSLKDLTLEVSEGHRWLIGCILYRTHIRLSTGWQKFVKENNLKAGNVCVFEMIEHALWEVHISRKWTSSPTLLKEEDGRHSSAKQGKGVVVPIHERHLRAKAFVTSKEKTRTTETTRVLKLKHPSFTRVITSSYLHYLRIPAPFFVRYLKDDLSSVTLEVSGGRRWFIGASVYNNGTNVHVTKGWQKFVRENELKEGDVCDFEMIKGALWKVHISRKSKHVLPTFQKRKRKTFTSKTRKGWCCADP